MATLNVFNPTKPTQVFPKSFKTGRYSKNHRKNDSTYRRPQSYPKFPIRQKTFQNTSTNSMAHVVFRFIHEARSISLQNEQGKQELTIGRGISSSMANLGTSHSFRARSPLVCTKRDTRKLLIFHDCIERSLSRFFRFGNWLSTAPLKCHIFAEFRRINYLPRWD